MEQPHLECVLWMTFSNAFGLVTDQLKVFDRGYSNIISFSQFHGSETAVSSCTVTELPCQSKNKGSSPQKLCVVSQ